MFRKIIFWSHLVAGVGAGLVILMMSATGVLLTYEYQMIESADMKLLASEPADEQPLSLEEVMALAGDQLSENISGVTVRNNPDAPYQVTYDRRGSTYVDPRSGEILGSGAEGPRNFLGAMRGWHRWFNVNGDGRDTARVITGASNVLFLFILISGLYLWLPKKWVVAAFKTRLWFRKAPTSKVRDYNWHHVFGFWSLIPLVAIVATATVFSYPAVRSTLNDITAEPEVETSERQNDSQGTEIRFPANAEPMGLDTLLTSVEQQLDTWYKITVSPGRNDTSPVQMRIAYKSNLAPSDQATWSINPYTGEVLAKTGWAELSTQAKANQIVRRLHTGEFYGIMGQTIAGLVSLFACIMVWTGVALAWRRLISPLFSRRTTGL